MSISRSKSSSKNGFLIKPSVVCFLAFWYFLSSTEKAVIKTTFALGSYSFIFVTAHGIHNGKYDAAVEQGLMDMIKKPAELDDLKFLIENYA